MMRNRNIKQITNDFDFYKEIHCVESNIIVFWLERGFLCNGFKFFVSFYAYTRIILETTCIEALNDSWTLDNWIPFYHMLCT